VEVAVSSRRQARPTIDFLLTHRRNAKAARRFLAKALRTRQHWPPHLITTDKNPAYGEALRQLKRDDPRIPRPSNTVRRNTSTTVSRPTTADNQITSFFALTASIIIW
jgi:transposase-like protein